MKTSVIYYHGGCPDGLVGAAVAHKSLSELHGDGTCSTYEIDYYVSQQDLQCGESHASCDELYFIDYCPNEAQLLVALEKHRPSQKVVIIDHHKGAQQTGEHLRAQYGVDFIFSLEDSGASLSYRYFYPDRELPEIVNDARDVDLWILKRPISLGFSTLIRQRNCIEFCKSLLDNDRYYASSDIASALYEYLSELADKQAKTAVLMDLHGESSDGTPVNIDCKIPVIMTDVSTGPLAIMRAAERFEDHGGRGIALGMYLHAASEPYQVKLSFRGTGKLPCLDIAQQIGGNGHTYAAGAYVKEAHVVMSGATPSLTLYI